MKTSWAAVLENGTFSQEKVMQGGVRAVKEKPLLIFLYGIVIWFWKLSHHPLPSPSLSKSWRS